MLRLVVAAVGLLALLGLEWLFGDTLDRFAADLLGGLAAVPRWIVDVVVIATRALAVVILVGGLLWKLAARRWRMLATVALAGAVAALGAVLLDQVVGEAAAPAAVEVRTLVEGVDGGDFPTVAGIAVVAAVLTAAAPWLSRRWRRLGWLLLAGLVVTRFLTAPASLDSLVAALAGWVAGAAALVVAGAPSRRPARGAIMAGLAAVGSPTADLRPASVDARGSTPYFGVDTDGNRLFVKALGDDERSADLLFRLYRTLRPRDFGDDRPFSSLRRGVEHEALVALAARNLGVRTPALVAFATAEPNGYVLAYEAIEGRSLDRVEPAELTDEVLAEVWRLLGELRHHRVAHRDLRLANLFLDAEGHAWLIDFGFSELAASDTLLATDVAELLASSCLVVGVERAVAHAATVIDAVGLAGAESRLRPWALSGATRAAHKARPGLLAELRRQVRATSAAGPASPVPLPVPASGPTDRASHAGPGSPDPTAP